MRIDRKRITVNSTLSRVAELSGHIFEVPYPCTVHGLFLEATGTVIFESVWCDGISYEARELPAEEVQKFVDELRRAALIDPEF